MGKPYATELEQLSDTYSWCLQASVSGLADWIRNSADRTLLVVGSGGSFTAASFTEFLHQICTGRIAKARGAPVEAVNSVIGAHVQGPYFGFLGQPRVNVLNLNIALDKLSR